MTVYMDTGGQFQTQVKKIIENEMAEVVFNKIKSLSPAMRAKDSDENKIKMDKMKREEAQKAVKEANEKTGEEKKRIFDEAKTKEVEMKKVQAEKAKLN
jgi:hypothetical protein